MANITVMGNSRKIKIIDAGDCWEATGLTQISIPVDDVFHSNSPESQATSINDVLTPPITINHDSVTGYCPGIFLISMEDAPTIDIASRIAADKFNVSIDDVSFCGLEKTDKDFVINNELFMRCG